MFRQRRIFSILFIMTFLLQNIFTQLFIPSSALAASMIIDEAFDQEGTVKVGGFNFNTQNGTIAREIVDGKTGKSVAIKTGASGTSQTPNLERTITKQTGKIILEAAVRSEDTAVEKQIFYVRDSKNNATVLLVLDSRGNITINRSQIVGQYEAGVWFNVQIAVDLDKQLMDVYLNGKKKSVRQPLPGLPSKIQDVTVFRFTQSDTNGSGGKLYVDDVKVYVGTTPLQPAPLPKQSESQGENGSIHGSNIRPNLTDYGPSLMKKIGKAVGLYVGSSNALVNQKKVKIDPNNDQVKPVNIDGNTMIPVKFLADSIKAETSWDDATRSLTIKYSGKSILMNIGQPQLSVNEKKVEIAVAPAIMNDRVFVPLRAVVNALGLNVFWDDRGLIVISDNEQIFNASTDKDLISEFIHILLYERPKAVDIIATLKKKNPDKQHPRLMATQETFDVLRERIKTDQYLSKWFLVVKKNADVFLTTPIQPYITNPTSSNDILYAGRRVKDRIETLSLLYKLTDNKAYADRAWLEMENAANWPNWDKEYLTTSEMTAGMAIGYDWLYQYLTDEQKKITEDAIRKHGFNTLIVQYQKSASWITGWNNWNLVCNGGLGMGAIVLGDNGNSDDERVAGQILESALRSLEYPLDAFAPEGAWPEGIMYMTYGTKYLVEFLSSLDTALGTDYGLLNAPALDKSMIQPQYMQGTKGYFNYSDAFEGYLDVPQSLFFAQKYNNPSITGLRISAIEGGRQPNVYDLLWFDPDNIAKAALPLDRAYKGIETGSLRNSWEDTNAFYLGYHAGEVVSHNHADIGTFVMDANGVRWAMDLGSDTYNLPGYFGAQRYEYYRLRTEGHNVIVIDPDQSAGQDLKVQAKIIKSVSKPKGGFAIVNLNSAYPDKAIDVKRGYMLADNRQTMMVQDEVKLKQPSELYWFMHTKAEIQILPGGRSAILSAGGQRLYAVITGPNQGTFSVMDAAPLPSSPNYAGQTKNSGVRKLAIHFTNITQLNMAVKFIPLAPGEEVPTKISGYKMLSNWDIPDGALVDPTISTIELDGKEIEGFSPQKRNYSILLAEEATSIPKVTAKSSSLLKIKRLEESPDSVLIIASDQADPTVQKTYVVNFVYGASVGVPKDMKALPIASVFASATSQAVNNAQCTIDGKLDTRWSALGDVYIQYDLGSVKKASAVSLAWMSGDQRTAYFDILVSKDGSTWSTVFSGASSGTTNEPETYRFSERDIRYVKINCHGTNQSAWNSITETAIYEKINK